MQLSGEAEASGAQMSATIQALADKYASEGVHIILSLPNGTDTNTGNPKLGKEASVAIVKVLLPGIDHGEKGKDYKTMVSFEKWLGDLSSGTTWIDEMKIYEAKMQDKTPVPTHLFDSVFLRIIWFMNMYIRIMCTQVDMMSMKTPNEQGDMSFRWAIQH